jgi:hypothetical protein
MDLETDDARTGDRDMTTGMTSHDPMFTVIIPWADRPELATTLTRNRDMLAPYATETVVVNGGGRWDDLLAILQGVHVPALRAIDLRGAGFNRSLCLNIGALASRGTYLFFLDADIVLGSDILADATRLMPSDACFLTVDRIVETQPEGDGPATDGNGLRPDWSFLREEIRTTEMITRDGRRARLRTRLSPGHTKRSDGLVIVRRDHMFHVRGLNSRLMGWGYEDTDFQIRLQFLAGLERVEAGEVMHLSHGGTRDRQALLRNVCQCTANYSRGDYYGTLEEDRVQWADRLTHM